MLWVAAILAFCAGAAAPAVSENWVNLSSHGITAIAVDADSVTTARVDASDAGRAGATTSRVA